ncbi:MAG: hypothetical protein M3R29_05725 [Verrucomicrobiota bacterium]|nr:hypothetical protein [Verrucomicrobiota bacterium]
MGEEDKHTVRQDFFSQKWARALWEQGKTAKAFVRLTSGKEHVVRFYLIDPKSFPPDIQPPATQA